MIQLLINKISLYYPKIDWIVYSLASISIMSLLSDYVDLAVKSIGILSVAVLNFAKAYSYINKSKIKKNEQDS